MMASEEMSPGEILALPEEAFASIWRGLPAADKDNFPEPLRSQAIERYRRATPYIGHGADARGFPGSSKQSPSDSGSEWPESLDLEVLAECQPKLPVSVMEGVPIGYATGTFGHGGAGKSSIEFERAVCFASGIPFCGLEVKRRRVMFVSCEDRADVLHWRLTRICAHLGVDLASLRGWLQVIDLVGRDSILFAPDPRTGNTLTLVYGRLSERMREYGTEVLFLDGITDTFGGNENSRTEVKRFINMLLALIPSDTGALVLVGHVSKATAGGASGEGYSGSTAWHNSVRARWYLFPEMIAGEDGGAPERTGKLILELQKSNHGEVGAQIEFQWDENAHLFVGRAKNGMTVFDRKHQDRTEQAAIRRAIKACVDAGINVPAAMTGPRTALHVLVQRPEFPDTLKGGERSNSRRFWRQIEALRQMRHIADSSYRRADNRHSVATLILTPEGRAECA